MEFEDEGDTLMLDVVTLLVDEAERRIRMAERDKKDPLGLETLVEVPVEVRRRSEKVSEIQRTFVLAGR
jgi:hypothetical protein